MRAIWKGALSFGLINVPVNMYSATRDRELKFSLLHKKDLSEVRYARICKEEGKEIPYNELVKGFEVSKGNFVVLTEDDFKHASQAKTDTIDIQEFTDEDEIASIYYEKLYYLEPGKNASKAYVLLREALKKTKKVAIVKYVMKNHERYGVITVYKNLLILNQMRLQDEIVKPQLDIAENAKVNPKELSMAVQLIEQQTGKFTPEKYHDTYVEDLKRAIALKSKGKKVKRATEEAPTKPAKVHDIMSLLKASLDEKQPAKGTSKRKRKIA